MQLRGVPARRSMSAERATLCRVDRRKARTVTRSFLVRAAAALVASFGLVTAASADLSLTVPQSTAFAILGHSCGGIQEQVFATGFDVVTGYPAGDVYLQTHCGGSGHSSQGTTYTAWAAVTWD